MTVTDCRPFLADIDSALLDKYRKWETFDSLRPVKYTEPSLGIMSAEKECDDKMETAMALGRPPMESCKAQMSVVSSKIITLEDFIDTDAVSNYVAELTLYTTWLIPYTNHSLPQALPL